MSAEGGRPLFSSPSSSEFESSLMPCSQYYGTLVIEGRRGRARYRVSSSIRFRASN